MDPARENEQLRLSALTSLGLSDSQQDERFNRITRLTAQLFSVPIAGLTLIDREEIKFKSIYGLQQKSLARDQSFSNLIIEKGEMVVIEDTSKWEECSSFYLVTQGPKIRFYVGIPIKTPQNYIIGEFFIASNFPRKFTDFEREVLTSLSNWIKTEIVIETKEIKFSQEHSKVQEELNSKNRELATEKAEDDAILSGIGDGVIAINDKGEVVYINKQVEMLTGFTGEELINKPLWYGLKMFDNEGHEVEVNKRPIRNALFSKRKITTSNF